MMDRSDHRLNVAIERFIEQWDGTSIGDAVKNMYENGTSYEYICDATDGRIDYEDYREE